MSELDEGALLALAYEAAEKGAAVLEENFPHDRAEPLAIERKASPIDIVTEVDRESERAIVDVLRASGLPIVAEEGTGTSARRGPALWYVDPLDGTTNYAHGHPFFCVSIALVVGADEEPRVGVIWAPRLNLVWAGTADHARRSDRARGREKTLAVSTAASLDDALFTTGFPYDRRTTDDDNVEPFRAMLKHTMGVTRCGSAAIDLAFVADGTYDGYWERKLKPWDLAAGAALVRAAKGKVTDPWGRPFRADEGSILATNGRLHEAARALLSTKLPDAPSRASVNDRTLLDGTA